MKTPSAILLSALLATAALFAEEKNAKPAATPARPLQLAPEPAPSGNPLIPEILPPTKKPSGSAIPEPSSRAPAGKPARTNKTQAAEDEVRARIQYRLAKNKAVQDPAVQAAWDAAQKAKTDLEKREAMKRYYTLLNARIRKIDGAVAKLANERQNFSTHRLEQTRIDPTEPLDPDERTERQGRDR